MDNKVYEIVSERILSIIETTGKLAWVKDWKHYTHGPANGVSKRAYDAYGINFFLFSNAPFSSPYFLTFKQVQDLGGNVRKGEKAWPVVFWKISKFTKQDAEGKDVEKSFPLLRYYNVFNVEQCEGITIEANELSKMNHNPIEAAETIIKNYKNGPAIEIKNSDQAYYMPSRDTVVMPAISQFQHAEMYYSTFFHELAHSTGHTSRLNRKEVTGINAFGSFDYGVEELTAELTAAFLCKESGISNDTTDRNNAAYVKSWMKTIKADPQIFVTAASRAGKAARHILNVINVTPEQEN